MVESHLDIVNEFPYLSSNGVDTIKVRNFVSLIESVVQYCLNVLKIVVVNCSTFYPYIKGELMVIDIVHFSN